MTSLAIALLLAAAQDAAETPAQKYQAIQKEYQVAHQRFSDLYGEAKSEEERRKLFESDYPDAKAYAQRFLALAAEAKGTPVALDCHVWVLQSAGEGGLGVRSYDALLADHLQSPKLLEAVATVGRYTPTIAAEKFARTIAEKSPHHDVKGQATYALAGVLLALASLHDTVLGPDAAPETRRTYAQHYGEETIAELETRVPEEMRGEAEDLLEDVASDYAKVKSNDRTLGEVADGDLFELRNLQIGQVAPDILGMDLDGVAFKLSDYRGKVVVVDFWGFW